MRLLSKILAAFFLCSMLVTALYADKRPVTVDDMTAFKDLGRPVISPDGKKIAYIVTYYCDKKEKKVGHIYLVDIDGKNTRKLTTHDSIESTPSWDPTGRKLAFSAARDGGKSQVYVIDIGGGEAERLTNIECGASKPSWSPDGKWIAFYSSVGQLYSDEFKKEMGDVRFITRLRYYHVSEWDDGKRNRIFVIAAEGSGEPIRLTKGACADEGDYSMAWAPDSNEIAFVSNRDPEWWNSIDTDIYTVSVPGGQIKKITDNRGPDHSPAYSPDGRYIAYRSIFTYNYESENYKLVVIPREGRSKASTLTTRLDRPVRDFKWSRDSKRIFFRYDHHGNRNIKSVKVQGGSFKDVLVGPFTVDSWDLAPDDKTFVINKLDDSHEIEMFTYHHKRAWHRLTALNTKVMAGFDVRPSGDFWVTGSDGSKIQAWIIKPVGFEKGKKYPMILSIHGGPHGMTTDVYRFFFQLLAANGYVVVYSNPRASLGYGEKFSRQIWENWGGLCYRDIMCVVDEVLKKGFVDEERMGVTGVSFGGYMTNWIVGHTDRFAAAVSVAGLSNLTSFYGTTDEQFFPEAEFKGAPWENKKIYVEHSPIWYAGNFKTPTMVIHGERDLRVRTEQAEQMFTALQKRKVTSVYVYFPNEAHGVRKTKNRKLYYKIMLDWFGHYLQDKPSKYLQMAAQKQE